MQSCRKSEPCSVSRHDIPSLIHSPTHGRIEELEKEVERLQIHIRHLESLPANMTAAAIAQPEAGPSAAHVDEVVTEHETRGSFGVQANGSDLGRAYFTRWVVPVCLYSSADQERHTARLLTSLMTSKTLMMLVIPMLLFRRRSCGKKRRRVVRKNDTWRCSTSRPVV